MLIRLLCLELGCLAAESPRGLRDRTPAPPGRARPSYAVAPGVSSEETTARGEQVGRRKAGTVAHRGPPWDTCRLSYYV